ncbi:hypothetical protein BS17DRAFT_820785 [Gyrodon lividus]|nr:hypothetical protein BS17DRAFT_820785 [Gyrodon lividus]
MTNRRHGELLLNLGITFHPICKEPLVGLWRLEQLEASFGASGFVHGNVHHTCTLGNAYNLAYEAVRPNDNCPTFVLDSNAYACNPQFMQECHLAIEMYKGKAKERSYGIRDEYRLSGFAAMEVLDNLKALTEHYLKSQPMLWMSSATWFDFLARRFRELQRMQICLRRIEPPNMGVLTGIVCNMIRSITSTPIILDFHKVVGKPWVISKQGKVQFMTNPMFYRILGLAEAGAPIQRRTGPRAIKPIQEFTMDMYRFAGYDELVARQSLYLERRRLQMAREKTPSQKDQDNCSMDALSDDHDVFMEELFGPEDGEVSMEDVLGPEDGDISMEDVPGPEDGDISMEDAIQGENGDVDMMSSSGEEEGPFEALVEEEDDSDYDCGTEDEDEMEDED